MDREPSDLMMIEDSTANADREGTTASSGTSYGGTSGTLSRWREHEAYLEARLAEISGEEDASSITENVEAEDDVEICIVADDGTNFFVSKRLLRLRSAYCATMFSSDSFIECKNGVLSLPGHESSLLGAIIAWLRCDATNDCEGVAAAEAVLLSADAIVASARLAAYLGMKDLIDVITERMADAVDVDNAASLLGLARELDCSKLRARVVDFAVRNLSEVEQSEFYEDLSSATKLLLRRARSAANNSIAARFLNDITSREHEHSEEIVGVLAEALTELRERLDDAEKRQALQLRECGRTAAWRYAQRQIDRQAIAVEGFANFVELNSALLMPGQK